MENKLDKWLKAAKNQTPVISAKEVGAMISQSPAMAKFSTLKKSIIMGTSATMIAVLAYYIFTPNVPTQQTTILPQTKVASQPQLSHQHEIKTEPLTQKSAQVFQPYLSNRNEPTWSALPFAQALSIDSTGEKYEVMPSRGVSSVGGFEWNDGVVDNVLVFTNEQLESLGIYVTKTSLEFAGLRITEEDSTYFSISIDGKNMVITHTSSQDILKYAKLNPKTEYMNMPDLIEYENSKGESFPMLVLHKTIKAENDKKKFLEEIKPLLVGVEVKVKLRTKEGETYRFWYKPTSSFMKVVPSDLKSQALKIQSNYTDAEYYRIVAQNKTEGLVRSQIQLTQQEQDLLQSRIVTLNEDELKKLKILVRNDGFVYSDIIKFKNKTLKLKIESKSAVQSSYEQEEKFLQGIFRSEEKSIIPIAFAIGDFKNFSLVDLDNTLGKRVENHKSFLMDTLTSCIGVKVNYKAKNNANSFSIIWFPVTDALAKALPAKAVEKLSNSFLKAVPTIDLKQVRIMQLNDEQLNVLGVFKNQKYGILVPHKAKTDLRDKQIYIGYTKDAEHFGRFANEPSIDGSNDSVQIFTDKGTSIEFKYVYTLASATKNWPEPALVTDDLGLEWRYSIYQNSLIDRKELKDLYDKNMPMDSAKSFAIADSIGAIETMKRINTLIPILVRSGEEYTLADKIKGSWRPDLLLWYEPSEKLLALLPKETGEGVKQELESIQQQRAPASCTYFEQCQNVKGKISNHLFYPNPAKDEAQLDIELGEERMLTVSITDISGKEVRVCVQNEQLPQGKSTIPIRMQGLNDGMYLLRIETDKGERIVQRVVKR